MTSSEPTTTPLPGQREEQITRALAAVYRDLSDEALGRMITTQTEQRDRAKRLLDYESIALNLLNMEKYDRDVRADRLRRETEGGDHA